MLLQHHRCTAGVSEAVVGAAATKLEGTHCIKPCRFMAPSVTLVTTACVSRKLIQPMPAAAPLKLPALCLSRRCCPLLCCCCPASSSSRLCARCPGDCYFTVKWSRSASRHHWAGSCRDRRARDWMDG